MYPLRQDHQHHPHVLGDAEQQTAQVLFVLVLVFGCDDRFDVGDLADARQVADHLGDAGAEAIAQMGLAQIAVVHAAVEHESPIDSGWRSPKPWRFQ